MTDNEKRKVILKFLYNHRLENKRTKVTPEDVSGMPESEINRISRQLDDAGQINGDFSNDSETGPHGELHSAVITGRGVDVIEG